MGFNNSVSRKEAVTAVGFLVFSTLYLGSALRLKVGTAGNPGPGFLPILIGVWLSVCALVWLVRLFVKKDAPPADRPEPAPPPVGSTIVLATIRNRPASMMRTARSSPLLTPILSTRPPKKNMDSVIPAVKKLTIQSA